MRVTASLLQPWFPPAAEASTMTNACRLCFNEMPQMKEMVEVSHPCISMINSLVCSQDLLHSHCHVLFILQRKTFSRLSVFTFN